MKKVAGLVFAAGFAFLNTVSADKFLISDSEPIKPISLAATNWTLTAPDSPTEAGNGVIVQNLYSSTDGSISTYTKKSMNDTYVSTSVTSYTASASTGTVLTTETISNVTSGGATTVTTTDYDSTSAMTGKTIEVTSTSSTGAVTDVTTTYDSAGVITMVVTVTTSTSGQDTTIVTTTDPYTAGVKGTSVTSTTVMTTVAVNDYTKQITYTVDGVKTRYDTQYDDGEIMNATQTLYDTDGTTSLSITKFYQSTQDGIIVANWTTIASQKTTYQNITLTMSDYSYAYSVVVNYVSSLPVTTETYVYFNADGVETLWYKNFLISGNYLTEESITVYYSYSLFGYIASISAFAFLFVSALF